ncbi:hypothetical protein ES703_03741 [subsurface metagenome]
MVKSKWTSDLVLEGEILYNKKWKYELYEGNIFYSFFFVDCCSMLCHEF